MKQRVLAKRDALASMVLFTHFLGKKNKTEATMDSIDRKLTGMEDADRRRLSPETPETLINSAA